jgi:hypothetical protein
MVAVPYARGPRGPAPCAPPPPRLRGRAGGGDTGRA